MESCDVLLTYEIKNREIENLCLIKRELERRGYSVRMEMQYGTFFKTEPPIDAKLVVVPAYYRPRAQFYTTSHTVRTERIFNMQWEQVFGADREDQVMMINSIKPWGRVAAHVAWGKQMEGRLINEWGVAPDHTFLTGHVALDYLRGPLRRYYEDRETVFSRFNIPTDKRVHLFISSLAAADAGLRVLKNSSLDGKADKAMESAKLSAETRQLLLEWFEKALADNPDDVIVYRPHPEELKSPVLLALAERQPRFFVISEMTIRQWILICDKIYSWMSTSAAEVYAAGKGCSVLRPLEVSYSSDIKIYHAAPKITTYEQFAEEFLRTEQKMAIPEDMLLNYYYIPKDRYSFELVCDAIEKVLKEDAYRLDPPMKNRLTGTPVNMERIKNAIKRGVANSKFLESLYKGGKLPNGKFKELLDNVFYVKEKLAKNYASDEEIAGIIRRIDWAFEQEKAGQSENA